MPQTNGIYVYPMDSSSSTVIRFYDDGVVLFSSSTNDYKNVMTWLNRDPENKSRVYKGKYKINPKSCAMQFHVKGEQGKQSYVGFVDEKGKLWLPIFIPKGTPKGNTRPHRAYQFIQM